MLNLYDKDLEKNPGKFKDIAEDIRKQTESNDIANTIAKYREEMITVLKNNIAEGKTDEDVLFDLKDKLEHKKSDELEPGLGTMGTLNFGNNDDIIDFWKGVVDKSKLTGAKVADTTDFENKVDEALRNIQFLHDNKEGKQLKDKKLFKGMSTEITDFEETMKKSNIQDVLLQTEPLKVADDVTAFVNSMKKPDGNAFYIRIIDKLWNDAQGEVAMRISLFLYCLKKLIKDKELTQDVHDRAKDILENQIIKEEIPKLKGLHNAKIELGYIVPEYETLRDLNVKKGDISLGDKDFTTGLVESQDLTSQFENGIAVGIEKYEIDNVEITDADGNILPVVLTEPSGRTLSTLFSNIHDGEKSADVCITIGGHNIKIGQLILDNTAGSAKLHIKMDDLATISGKVSALGVFLPKFPFEFNIPVMGIKNVKNRLEGCKASLVKCVKFKAVTGGSVIPPPPPPTIGDLEIDATISDMGANVLREKVALEVGQEMEKEYADLPKGDVINRMRFFFGRGKMKEKRIKERMDSLSGKAFSGDATLDSQIENAADRHELENILEKNDKLDGKSINEVTAYENNDEINKLCKDYLDGIIDDAQFQNTFNNLLEVGTAKDLKDRLDNEKITHIGTNLLLKMKQQKAWKILIDAVEADLNSYVSGGAVETSYVDNMNKAIEDYIKMYQDNPVELLGKYNNYRLDPTKLDELRNYLSQQKAIMSLATNNIKIRLNILKGGRSAYQINNEKREKSVFYRAGRRMDDHPRWTAGLTAGSTVAIGLATGGLGAFWGALIPTVGLAGIVGTTNATKKWTHHTKEQKIHEESLVTDNAAEKKRIADLVDTATNGHGWKKYKAKRQLALYDKTTQNEIEIANNITDNIMNLASNVSVVDDNPLKLNLIEGWARLKYYREVGHNFLASDEKTKTEEDMNRLEKAIFVGLGRLGSTDPIDIEGYTVPSRFTGGSDIKFGDTYDKIKKDFEKTNKKFKRQRLDLSLRYGICTGLLSAGTAVGMQYLTHSGMFAGKGTEAVKGFTGESVSVSNQFDLGKHEILDPGIRDGIYEGTQRAIAPAPDGCTINIHYGAGTDATPFASGREITLKNLQDKVDFISGEIDRMNLGANADVFKNELADIRLGNGVGTNGYLQNMRHAEFLEQTAQALSDSGRAGDMVVQLNHDITGLDVVGTHLKDSSERVVNGLIEVSKEEIPGTKARTWGRWIMGAPTFFNTFEDRKAA